MKMKNNEETEELEKDKQGNYTKIYNTQVKQERIQTS